MKTVFSNHELPHIWASQSQPEGRANSMRFEGDTLFSYREPIARILPGGYVAITTRDWSVTTNRHVSRAASATSHMKRVHIRDVVTSPERQRAEVMLHIEELMREAAKSRAPKNDRLRASAVHVAESFNLYAKVCGSRCRINTTKIAGSDLKALKAKFERDDELAKARRAREAKAQAKRVELQTKEAIINFRATGAMSSYVRYAPTLLRLNMGENNVETSRGARIPIDAAIKLWPVIQRVMTGDRDYDVGMELGHYYLTKIRRDGSIVVGCHDIAFNEIEGIAHELGLTNTSEAQRAFAGVAA